MTIKNNFATNFSKVVLSASVFVLCASLFVFSINGASATNDDTEFNFPDKLSNSDIAALQSSNSGGRYQMSLSTLTDENAATYWYILVWDTQTGRSKFYYGCVADGTQAAYGKFQLPSSPL